MVRDGTTLELFQKNDENGKIHGDYRQVTKTLQRIEKDKKYVYDNAKIVSSLFLQRKVYNGLRGHQKVIFYLLKEDKNLLTNLPNLPESLIKALLKIKNLHLDKDNHQDNSTNLETKTDYLLIENPRNLEPYLTSDITKSIISNRKKKISSVCNSHKFFLSNYIN